ncbi:MAG: adenylate/guanylate cyclase domain-containing protein, partial [Proteobacteria bacterium]|nr:adenylate/guanylate cyclase domain-containing protein [Pseudomonadota bacterium]
KNGLHLWAERYDREIHDVFAVQDDVVRNIVLALGKRLQLDIPVPAEHPPTVNIEAYEWLVKGRQNVFRAQGRAESRHALQLALALDPNLSDAHAWLAVYHYSDWAFYHEHITEDSMDKALQSAQKAIDLGPQSALAHMSLGIVKLYIGKREEALEALNTALKLKPSDADVLVFIQEAYTFNGEPRKGIESVQLAMRLNPHYPEWYLWHLGFAYYAAGLYEEAIETLIKVSDTMEPRRILAAALAMVGRIDEAQTVARGFMAVFPDFSAKAWARTQSFRHTHELDKFIEGYRSAGLAD